MKLVTALIISIVFVVSTVPAYAWEERLKECASLGISPANCPDDDSILVPPAKKVTHSVHHGGVGMKYYWRITNAEINAGIVCYDAYFVKVFVDSNNVRTEFPYTDMMQTGCFYATNRLATINLKQ